MGLSSDFIQGVNFSLFAYAILSFVSILILLGKAAAQDKQMKSCFSKAIYSLLVLVVFFIIRQIHLYNGMTSVDFPFAMVYIIAVAYFLRQIYKYLFRFLEYKGVPLSRTARARFIAGSVVMICVTAVLIVMMVIYGRQSSPSWELVCWTPILVFHIFAAYILIKRKSKIGGMPFYAWLLFLYFPGIVDVITKAFAPDLNASVLAYCLLIPILYTGVQAQEGNYSVLELKESKRILEEKGRMQDVISALAYEYSTVISLDLNTDELMIYKINERHRDMYGDIVQQKSYTTALNMFIDRFVSEEDKEKVRKQISAQFIKDTLEWPDNITLTYKNIVGRYGAQKIVRVNKDMAVIGFVDRHKEINEYNRKVYEDSLTKLRNRRYLDEKLMHREVQALVMIDADNFKEINDTFGHLCGDKVLAVVSGLLLVHIRSMDCALRYGGDEFIIAFPDIPYEIFEEKLKNILEAVERIRLTDYPECRLTLSMGGVYRWGTVEELIMIADSALYESKNEKNKITIKTE